MLPLVFKNRLVKVIATTAFICVITLFGFSSYTHQKVEHYAESHIYRNPSQLPVSQIAYLPARLIEKTSHSPELQSWLVERLQELHDSGRVRYVVCEGAIKSALQQKDIPVILYPSNSSSVHHEIMAILTDLNPASLLIIADENYLEQGLYSLKTFNVKACGWDYRRDNDKSLQFSQYLSHVRLYFDCEFSQTNPLIANPRYTLDIQH